MPVDISVVIPTLGDLHLRNTLRECEMGGFDVEIIIVDGSGEKQAKNIAEEFGANYIHQGPNGGPHEAREIGARSASGDYIQFLDDDDILLPGKLSKQVDILRSSEDVGVVYCGFYRDGREVLPDPSVRGDVLADALSISRLSVCSTSTMLMESDLVRDLIPFQNKHGADDTGMVIELAKRTEFEHVREPLVERGSPDRETSFANINGREHLFDMYEDLYAQFPENVRSQARATYFLRKGTREVETSLWSPGAIRSFVNHIKFSWKSDRSVIFPLLVLCVSLFGRPGWEFAKMVQKRHSGLPQ